MLPHKKWDIVPLSDAVDICDTLRRPINAKERQARISGKKQSDLFPYYGATGQVGYIDDYITDGEYVLLGEDGAPFLDAYSEKAYIITGKTWVNNHAHVLRSKTNNKFLCYYLNFFNYNGFVSGTTRLKLTQGMMRQIPVPMPAVDEQERIVARIEELFSELDNGVETLRKTKQQLAVYRQAVVKAVLDVHCVEAKVATIGEVCHDVKVGIVIKPTQYYVESGGIRAFRNANVRRNRIEDDDWAMISLEGHERNSRSTVHTGDVLIARSGVNLGMACAVPEQYDGYNAVDVVIAVPKQDKVLSHYLAYYTNSPYGISSVRQNQRGVAQGHLNTTVYQKLPILLPPIGVQESVIEEIEAQLSTSDSIEKTVDAALLQAEAMRQSILKKAFEGGL